MSSFLSFNLSPNALATAYKSACISHLIGSGMLGSSHKTLSLISPPAEGDAFIHNNPLTAFDLYQRHRGVCLGISEVDASLQGGVPSGFVVEVAGASGSGKSRLLSLIAARNAVFEGIRAVHQAPASHALPTHHPSPSILYVQCDHHCRHAFANLKEAVRYHATLQWEGMGLSSEVDGGLYGEEGAPPQSHQFHRTPDVHSLTLEAIISAAFDQIALLDIPSALGTSLESDGGVGSHCIFEHVVQAIQSHLIEWGSEGESSATRPTRIIMIDSVASLVKRVHPGGHTGTFDKSTSVRHDAIAKFIQSLKDLAAFFNAVVFITNHVVSERSVPTRDGADSVVVDTNEHRAIESAIKGAFGTSFYHAVNIRILLLARSSSDDWVGAGGGTVSTANSVLLHIAKSPICPPHTFALAGLDGPLKCYEAIHSSSARQRLRPSVRVIETLTS